MKDFANSEIIWELGDITANMYRMGWNERNGGNISWLLDEEAIQDYIDPGAVKRTIPLAFDAGELNGRIFLVTGTGKYFKNIKRSPEKNVGVVRIAAGGKELEVLWGFEGGARPTSELPTHLMNHMARLRVDPKHRVVMHCHPVNVIAMTFVHEQDDREFTLSLWGTCTECVLVFYDGVGIVPWMPAGTNAIAEATAEKLKDRRIVVWGQHGIFGTGRDLDEAFGLIETVEKAAEIYMKTASLPKVNCLPKEQLLDVARVYGVTPREEFLLDSSEVR